MAGKIDPVTILHVSDIQFGHNHRFGQLANQDSPNVPFDTVFQRLADDLAERAKEGWHPQVIVVSGDLAEWGLPQEFSDALNFLVSLSRITGLDHKRVVVVPGNHDINRSLSEGYFANCRGDDVLPQEPYWPKWKHFRHLMEQFYGSTDESRFDEPRPWSLFEMEELKFVVAGFNSTIRESHREEDHYGWIGEDQIRWFGDRLAGYQEKGWFRLGVVHHNVVRGAVDDEENLRDAEMFKQRTGPLLNMILHGHTHKDDLGWADSNVPIISTGSASLKKEARLEDVGNQYQWIRLWPDRFERATRRYDGGQKRWIGDTRCSPAGDSWHFSKDVAFSSVNETFAVGTQSTTVKPTSEDRQIVHVDKPLGAQAARARLRSLPRFRLRAENHHRAVRRSEQELLETIISSGHVAWLVADWGMGKEGFLASALERFGGPEALADVFRLQCGVMKDCEELLAEAETQLGLSFQEYFAAVAAIPNAVLVFDDLPSALLQGDEREVFERRIRSIVDFCPSLRLIFVTRQVPGATDPGEVVQLLPLEAPETRNYLKHHIHARPGLDGEHEVDRIHQWSGGLPMHLDRLLERLQYLSLSDILEDDNEVQVGTLAEALPVSLRNTVAVLTNSEDSVSRQTFRLLKVLTILRDGETFQSIRRFYPQHPFHQRNVDQLVSLALLEDVPISQTVAVLSLHSGQRGTRAYDTPQLLRVPRQVRDHVNSIVDDDERDEIIGTSTGLFFGEKWWQGKVRVRNSLSNAYGQSAIAGPGNEHVVARHLLAKALDKRNKRQVDRYAKLALTYSHKLIGADRFRDSLIASRAVVDLLGDTDFHLYFSDAAHMCGRSLRMTGRVPEAIEMLNSALSRGGSMLIDENRASIQLSLALSYQDLGRDKEALACARDVLKLVHKESDPGYQAQSLVAELTLSGGARKSRLVELEQKARNKGRVRAANNIALDLAHAVSEPKEALEWVEKVIYSARDNYSRTRAIIEKVSALGSHFRISDLSDNDQALLSAAYSYSYAQRIGNLLDKCHNVLWGVFRREQRWASVLRLFRFSSFIWRLRGIEEKERECLRELESLDLLALQDKEGRVLQMEILYLERRRGSVHGFKVL